MSNYPQTLTKSSINQTNLIKQNNQIISKPCLQIKNKYYKVHLLWKVLHKVIKYYIYIYISDGSVPVIGSNGSGQNR